jgi:hypothetical protein
MQATKFKDSIMMNSIKRIPNILKSVAMLQHQMSQIQDSIYYIQQALGRIENRQCEPGSIKDIKDSEFKVSSQWGEDGIIQYLLKCIQINRNVFVEFGVQDYRESNTRFLLANNNWSGMVLDGDDEYIKFIKNDPIYWRYNLKAVKAFITSENINSLLEDNGITGEIGLLSVDIDGNDYWVWKAINVINPAIVVAEYNSRFGPSKALTTPYDPAFVRSKAHHSMIYYGTSLQALCLIAEEKGYDLVGCNSAGNNAFFVRKDLRPDYMPALTSEEAYVAGQFRESRHEDGQLMLLTLEEETKLLDSLPLVEVE